MPLTLSQIAQASCISECHIPLTPAMLDTYFPVSRIQRSSSLKEMLRRRVEICPDISPTAKTKNDPAWQRAMLADIEMFIGAFLHTPWFEGVTPCKENYALTALRPLLELAGHIERDSSGHLRRTIRSTHPGFWAGLPSPVGEPAFHRPIQILFDLHFALPRPHYCEPTDLDLRAEEFAQIMADCFAALCNLALCGTKETVIDLTLRKIDIAARVLANLCHSVLPLIALLHMFERLQHTAEAESLRTEIMCLVFRTADIAISAPERPADDWRIDHHPNGQCNQALDSALAKATLLHVSKKTAGVLGSLPSSPKDYITVAMSLNARLTQCPATLQTLIGYSPWPEELGVITSHSSIGHFVTDVLNSLLTMLTLDDCRIDDVELAIDANRTWLVNNDTNVASHISSNPGSLDNRKANVSCRIANIQAITAALEPYKSFLTESYTNLVLERLSPPFACLQQIISGFTSDNLPDRDVLQARAEAAQYELSDIILSMPPTAANNAAVQILIDTDFWPRATTGSDALLTADALYRKALDECQGAMSQPVSVAHMAHIKSLMGAAQEALEVLRLQIGEQEAICETILSRLRVARDAIATPPVATHSPDDAIAELRSRLEQVELEYFKSIDRERQLEKKLAAAQHALDEVRRPVVAGERTDARRFVDALASSSAAGSLSMADVVDLAEVLWPERLQLSVEARDIAAASPFERPVEALHAIYLLSHDYLDALAGPGGEERAKKVFPPAQFALGESESTLSSADHRAERLFTFEGVGQQLCARHIKIGTSRDPRHCARIYFTVAGGKILLGAAGQHLALPGAK